MSQDHLDEQDPLASRIDFALWRKILLFARPYRRDLLVLSVVAIFCAACDVLLPLLTGRIVDEIQTKGAEARVGTYGLLYLSTVAFLGLNIFAFIILAGRVATGVSHDIRRDCFAKLQALPFSFYDRKAVGWLMARLTSDCSSLSRILGWAMLDIVWGTVLLASVAVTMFVLSWKLALVVLLIVPPLLYVSRFFQVRLLLTSRLQRKANSHTTAAFNEGIVGVRTTKSFAREGQNLAEFTELTGSMYKHALDNALYSALFLPIVLTLCSLGVALALWRGGVAVSVGALSLGTLITFTQYAAFIQNPVQELANTLTLIQAAQASAERIQQLLDTDVEIQDSPEVLARLAHHAGVVASATTGSSNGSGDGRDAKPQAASPLDDTPLPSRTRSSNGARRTDYHPERSDTPRSDGSPTAVAPDGLPHTIHTLEFRHVSFAYKQGQPVLDDFSLTVRAGDTIAFVGPTGGGKSTIVSLACRFYEPTSGQILINGTDYRDRPLHWLQSNLGMVLQQPHLFSGSIRDNIRYGKLTATDDEIEQAARTVNAHDFITHLPQKYDTPVGEGGARLSTGQKQLISLARAVIADPQIFVMDEATSSVDTQTERAIQSAIDRVLHGRISFVIAHRLSTIRSATKILFIEQGKVVESGTHHALIQKRGRYYDLYTNQFTHEREAELLDHSPDLEDVGAA